MAADSKSASSLRSFSQLLLNFQFNYWKVTSVIYLLFSVKRPGCFELWLRGPSFLLQIGIEPRPVDTSVAVRKIRTTSELGFNKGETCLDKMIDASDLYTLKKRVGYLIAF